MMLKDVIRSRKSVASALATTLYLRNNYRNDKVWNIVSTEIYVRMQ
jgi:hypothetical protein